MSLIHFTKGDGTPVLINPDFIQEVSGSAVSTILVVKREENGQYVKHILPYSVETTLRMIQEAGS